MKPTKDELLAQYLPGPDGTPPKSTAKIVYHFVGKYRCRHLLDDLLQAVYLEVWRYIDRAAKVANPHGYLTVVIRYTLFDVIGGSDTVRVNSYGRKKGFKVATVNVNDPDSGRNIIEVAPDRPHALTYLIAEACEGLNAKETAMVEMLAAGYTQPEIGDKLGTSRRTVTRLRHKLRRMDDGLTADEAQEEVNRATRAKVATRRNRPSRRHAG